MSVKRKQKLTEFALSVLAIINASKHGAYTSQIANVLGTNAKRVRNHMEHLRAEGYIKSASVGNNLNVWLPIDGVPDPLAGANYSKPSLEKKEYAKRKPIDMGKPSFVPVRNGTTSSKNWTPPVMECARVDGNQFLSIGTVEQGREIPRMRPVIICAGVMNYGSISSGRTSRLA